MTPGAGTRAAGGAAVRRLLGPGAVLGAAAAVVALLAAVDPHEPGHYPVCPFLWLTGLYCPGCGTLRMINELVSGRPAAAFGRNPLVFLLLPLLGYLWVRWTVLSARGAAMNSTLLRPRVCYALTAVIAVYGVVRNLPFAAALAP
jgi:uncharacterized protein DUF2752